MEGGKERAGPEVKHSWQERQDWPQQTALPCAGSCGPARAYGRSEQSRSGSFEWFSLCSVLVTFSVTPVSGGWCRSVMPCWPGPALPGEGCPSVRLSSGLACPGPHRTAPSLHVHGHCAQAKDSFRVAPRAAFLYSV